MAGNRRPGAVGVTRQFGIGLVGAGRFGAFCVDAFGDLDGARVVAVVDEDADRARAVAPDGARVYGDYDELLADPDVDIVHIGTPPFLHGQLTLRAAEAGKHVFVEKPLATTMDDAVAAVDAAAANGVLVSIDYVLRHHPLHQLAIDVTRSGALGDLQHFALENLASSEALPADHWFWDPAMSGDIQVEHGVHFFDLCLALVGREPDAVSGTAQRRPDGRTDRVAALLGFGDGVTATFYHAFNRTHSTEQTTIRLTFELGQIVIDGWIPTDLALLATIPSASLEALRPLVPELEPGSAAAVAGGPIPVRARRSVPDRQAAYRLAVQRGMLDLIAAIEGTRPLRVTAADALRSLAVAIRATP
jgi:predicted dehydrogenase